MPACAFSHGGGACSGPLVERRYRVKDPDLPPIVADGIRAVVAAIEAKGDAVSDGAVARLWLCEQHDTLTRDRNVRIAFTDAYEVDDDD